MTSSVGVPRIPALCDCISEPHHFRSLFLSWFNLYSTYHEWCLNCMLMSWSALVQVLHLPGGIWGWRSDQNTSMPAWISQGMRWQVAERSSQVRLPLYLSSNLHETSNNFMCSMTSIGCLFHIFIYLACFWQEIFIRSCLLRELSLSPFCISVLSDSPLSLCDLSCDAECALYAVEMCAMLSHLNQVLKQQCKIIRHLWIIVHFLKLLSVGF